VKARVAIAVVILQALVLACCGVAHPQDKRNDVDARTKLAEQVFFEAAKLPIGKLMLSMMDPEKPKTDPFSPKHVFSRWKPAFLANCRLVPPPKKARQ